MLIYEGESNFSPGSGATPERLCAEEKLGDILASDQQVGMSAARMAEELRLALRRTRNKSGLNARTRVLARRTRTRHREALKQDSAVGSGPSAGKVPQAAIRTRVADIADDERSAAEWLRGVNATSTRRSRPARRSIGNPDVNEPSQQDRGVPPCRLGFDRHGWF